MGRRPTTNFRPGDSAIHENTEKSQKDFNFKHSMGSLYAISLTVRSITTLTYITVNYTVYCWRPGRHERVVRAAGAIILSNPDSKVYNTQISSRTHSQYRRVYGCLLSRCTSSCIDPQQIGMIFQPVEYVTGKTAVRLGCHCRMKLRIRVAHARFFSIATLIAKHRKRQDHERVLTDSKLLGFGRQFVQSHSRCRSGSGAARRISYHTW